MRTKNLWSYVYLDTRQNSDPPPEFTPHVLSRLTGPAWGACDALELEDVATADGVNMILDTVAEAFQGEFDVDGSHTAYALQAKEALIEQEEDIDLETAPAALELESDTDLEETDVQEIPLVKKRNHGSCGESSG